MFGKCNHEGRNHDSESFTTGDRHLFLQGRISNKTFRPAKLINNTCLGTDEVSAKLLDSIKFEKYYEMQEN